MLQAKLIARELGYVGGGIFDQCGAGIDPMTTKGIIVQTIYLEVQLAGFYL
jgi:hypothetical protein